MPAQTSVGSGNMISLGSSVKAEYRCLLMAEPQASQRNVSRRQPAVSYAALPVESSNAAKSLHTARSTGLTGVHSTKDARCEVHQKPCVFSAGKGTLSGSAP
jgi:hypothetical protein